VVDCGQGQNSAVLCSKMNTKIIKLLDIMKINFTKKEYRLLLDVLYLGQWMLDAHDTDESPKKKEYDMVVQKIYAHAKEMGCEDLIDASKEMAGYFPTREYEESSGVDGYIDEYNLHNFWEMLVEQLTERDVRADCISKNMKINSVEEYWKLSSPYEKKYAEEFQKHGLRRVTIRESERTAEVGS